MHNDLLCPAFTIMLDMASAAPITTAAMRAVAKSSSDHEPLQMLPGERLPDFRAGRPMMAGRTVT
jgi:hypothetical protein